MVYHVALAGAFACTSTRARVQPLEFNLGALAALDAGIGRRGCHGQANQQREHQGTFHAAVVLVWGK